VLTDGNILGLPSDASKQVTPILAGYSAIKSTSGVSWRRTPTGCWFSVADCDISKWWLVE